MTELQYQELDPRLEDITKYIEQCKKYIEDIEAKLSNYNNFANDIADIVDNLIGCNTYKKLEKC